MKWNEIKYIQQVTPKKKMQGTYKLPNIHDKKEIIQKIIIRKESISIIKASQNKDETSKIWKKNL